MEYKRGRVILDSHDRWLQIQGNDFMVNAIDEDCQIYKGNFIKEKHGEYAKDGEISFTYVWRIRCNGGNLVACIEVPFSYTNEGKEVLFEDIFPVAEAGIKYATDYLNNELEIRNVNIVQRQVKELDQIDKRFIHQVLDAGQSL